MKAQNTIKVASIVGARPNFIKLAPVSLAIEEHNKNSNKQIKEVIIHTAQHYDDNISKIFFKELNIPEPHYNLGVGSGPHGWQTGEMLKRIEKVLIKEKPDIIIVYGDTNSTLAGALAAVKLHIPVAHLEAGLRSYNRRMPEEINRVLTDHSSSILFCPTKAAVENLKREGITGTVNNGEFVESVDVIPLISCSLPLVVNVGDVMYDSVLQFSEIARRQSTILEDLELKSKEYLLATVHRPYNTDVPENLQNILSGFLEIDEPIIFPVHPRTKKILNSNYSSLLTPRSSLKMIEPVGYLDMLVLEQNARAILTDSGGMQKEAYFFGVPCVTMRTETEWVETIEAGWNVLVGADREKIVETAMSFKLDNPRPELYGDGRAAEKILKILCDRVSCRGAEL
mgnify:CR=1 FL=1